MDNTARAKNIKAIVFDSVGVIFSETVLFGAEEGEKFRVRSHADGQGISLLRSAGIAVAFITSETTGFLEKIGEKLNNLPAVKEGKMDAINVFTGASGKDKSATISSWLSEKGLSFEECAYVGDDVGDYEIMKKVGFAGAPAQAEKIIKDVAHFVASRRGGDGAVRDVCNFILEAKNIDPLSLTRK